MKPLKLKADRARPVVIRFLTPQGKLAEVVAWFYFPAGAGLQCSMYVIHGMNWTRKNSCGHAIFDLLRAVVPKLHTAWTTSGHIPSVCSITTHLIEMGGSIAGLPEALWVGTYRDEDLAVHGVDDAMHLVADPTATKRNCTHTAPLIVASSSELAYH
jgi:hypothetical protein